MKQSLWSRDFVITSLGYFFLFLSISVFYLYPLHLDSFSTSKSAVGLIMGIHSVTAILIRPLFGRVMDEKGARPSAIVGLSIMILSIPGFYLVQGVVIAAIALRALNGIGWGLASTAMMKISADVGPPERLAHALGILGAAGIVSSAAGPLLAEEIMLRRSFDAVFTLSLLMLAGALVCMLAVRAAPLKRPASVATPVSGIRNIPLLVIVIIAAMPIVHGAVRGAVINFVALFGMEAGFGRVGPFFLAFSVAAIITRLVFGDLSDRHGRKRVIVPTAVAMGFNMFLLAGAYSYPVFLVSGFISGLVQGLLFPSLSTYVIDFLGRHNKGLALGIYLSLFDIGMGLGSPLFGAVSDTVGYRGMYTAAGIVTFLLTLVFRLKAPSMKEALIKHPA